MGKFRIGVIGAGAMGISHMEYMIKGEVPGAKLEAVCDASLERLSWVKEYYGERIKLFCDADDLFASGIVDGVIIATPHYHHPPLAMKAFQNGLHVLIEKPAGVYTKHVREMNEIAKKSRKVFGIMYQHRTNPLYQKVRDLVLSGELGEIKRTIWIVTTWYRPQSYYDSSEWRATWIEEGGGVLINQCPHNLDLWQWICDMPIRVRAFCSFGKYHDIEVEDDVTAYVEYKNGATGIFITSTGETPGTDRLEIVGEKGKIVVEDEKLLFWRLRVSERQFNLEFKDGFGEPECWKCEIPVKDKNISHVTITSDWVDSILNKTPLISPGIEGIKAVELINAMLLSSWLDDWVTLPIDEDTYYEKLQEKNQEFYI